MLCQVFLYLCFVGVHFCVTNGKRLAKDGGLVWRRRRVVQWHECWASRAPHFPWWLLQSTQRNGNATNKDIIFTSMWGRFVVHFVAGCSHRTRVLLPLGPRCKTVSNNAFVNNRPHSRTSVPFKSQLPGPWPFWHEIGVACFASYHGSWLPLWFE